MYLSNITDMSFELAPGGRNSTAVQKSPGAFTKVEGGIVFQAKGSSGA